MLMTTDIRTLAYVHCAYRWLTLGNQLGPDQIFEEELAARIKARCVVSVYFTRYVTESYFRYPERLGQGMGLPPHPMGF